MQKYRTTPTEQLLNDSRRPQASKRQAMEWSPLVFLLTYLSFILLHSIACLFIWQCLSLLRKFQFWCSQGYQIFSAYNLCFLISLLCYNDYVCIFFQEFGNFALSYLSSSIWNLFCSSFEVEIEDFDCGSEIPDTIYRQLFPHLFAMLPLAYSGSWNPWSLYSLYWWICLFLHYTTVFWLW